MLPVERGLQNVSNPDFGRFCSGLGPHLKDKRCL